LRIISFFSVTPLTIDEQLDYILSESIIMKVCDGVGPTCGSLFVVFCVFVCCLYFVVFVVVVVGGGGGGGSSVINVLYILLLN
jgi:hypothetical protein